MIRSSDVRKKILHLSYKAGVGHIGCALSVADIVCALYTQVLSIKDPEDHDRDRFILSKGHAALALYCLLNHKGWLSDSELDTFCKNNTLLGVHPEHAIPGIDFSTGSLGMGLSFGVGAALAARLQKSSRRIFVLMSDAECNEGSVWEAIMVAAQHKLNNLTAIVDCNGQQALGYTKDIIDLEPISERWRAFGWHTDEVDGHNLENIVEIIERYQGDLSQPHLLIARTIFGKGVSFMENKIAWHYRPLSEQDYRLALSELTS